MTTANEQELKVLAAMVEEKLRGVLTPGRPVTTQAMLLVAVALAHEAREQRARADAVAERAKGALRALLHRVDAALDAEEADSEPVAKAKRSQAAGKPTVGRHRPSECDMAATTV